MNHVIQIRALTPEEWALYRDLRLKALAESPEAFGSTLADEQARPDDWWVNRVAAGTSSGQDLPLVAVIDGEPAGLTWGRIDKADSGVANLYQMWVDPNRRRLGTGKMLLEAVIAWARGKNARYLDLGVTYRDSPAMRLYGRAGFEPVGRPHELRPGSELQGLRMRLNLRGFAQSPGSLIS